MSDVPPGSGGGPGFTPPNPSPWPHEPGPGLTPPPGGGPAPQGPAGPVAAGFIYQIGDIGVTGDTVVTPTGNAPLAGSVWTAFDYSRTSTGIPTWAIVMAIVFAVFCLLGLLFLLLKEESTSGFVEVRVQSSGFWHVCHIPVRSRLEVDRLLMQVAQVQAFAGRQAGW